VINLEIEGDHSFGAFRFPVPGGFRLEQSRIGHLWQPDGDEAGPELRVLVDTGEAASAMDSFVRIAPLPAGRHRFELLYEARWPGDYAWPAMRLVLPRTGDLSRLTAGGRVTVLPVAP
jgi:hypothetical protein